MKNTYKLMLIVLFLSFMLSLSSQNRIMVKNEITNDTTIVLSTPKNGLTAKSIFCSGDIEFHSKSGYLRILLTDASGYELLVYETFPLLITNNIDLFRNVAMETVNIPNDFSFSKIQVQIRNATLNQRN